MGWNDLTPEEREFQLQLIAALAMVTRAMEHHNSIQRECPHRVAEQKPATTWNGVDQYEVPECLVCGEFFECDHYCPKTGDHFCYYRVSWAEEPVRGDDFASDSRAQERDYDTADCVHCGEPWHRSE